MRHLQLISVKKYALYITRQLITLVMIWALLWTASAEAQNSLFTFPGSTGSPIAHDGFCSAATTACTFSGTATGSLKLVYAHHNASTTAPTRPVGWTLVATGATAAGGVLGSYTIGCNVSSSGADTGTGTWTGATDVEGISYSGTEAVNTLSCASLAIGILATNTAKTSTTLNFPGVTLQDASGESWVAGLAGNSAGGLGTPAGMTLVTSVGAGPSVIANDTNRGATTWPSTNVTITSSTWMSAVLEIFGEPKPSAAPAVLQSTFSQQSCTAPPSPCSDATTIGPPNPIATHAILVIGLHTNWSGSGTSTVTDTLGNTYFACGSSVSGVFTDVQIFSGFGASCHIAYNIIGGADTVFMASTDCTVSCTNTGGYYLELTGLPLTAAAGNDGVPVFRLSATSGTSPNNMSGGAFTTSAFGDLVFGIFDNASGNCSAGTTPTRFTMEANTAGYCLEWAAWGGKGSITPNLTLDTSGVSYGAFTVGFKHQ